MRLLALCLLLLAAAAPRAAADSEPARREGPWEVLTVFSMPSREVDHCAVEAQFAGGLAIALLKDHAGRMKLVVDLPGSPVAAGAPRRAAIAIDRRFQRQLSGRMETPTAFALSLGDDRPLRIALAEGSTLDIETPKGRFEVALDGASAALAALARCAAAKAPTPDPAIAAILGQVGPGQIQASRAVGATDPAPIEYSWTDGSVSAGARATPVGKGIRFVDLVLERVDALIQRCRGHFAPALEAPVETEGAVSETGNATCLSAEDSRAVALFYYRRGNRFIELALEAPAGDRPAAARLRDKLAKTLQLQPQLEKPDLR